MSLERGTRLGPYEIDSVLGAGGMGEVYRARDTRLKRDVAIKVLHAAFARDPDRLARLQREAEVLATLNHPNVGAVYGFEETPDASGIVMELVEGPTLGDRIAQSPVPFEEALTIARQIADALDAAHEQGIIHRDLKPANIKITPGGKVKVLDFGLAKMAEGPPKGGHYDDRSVQPQPDLTMSPTLAVHATTAGLILGTAGYMSPEQARGKTVDRRSDIWAFGCVLFEMLTGRKAFETGETVSDAVAALLTKDPDYGSQSPGAVTLTVRLNGFEQRYAFGAGITMANYDVTRDGQRFIMVKDESGAARLNVILNWLSELKRVAPTTARVNVACPLNTDSIAAAAHFSPSAPSIRPSRRSPDRRARSAARPAAGSRS